MQFNHIIVKATAALLFLPTVADVAAQPASATLPTDLGTRGFGQDWPIFLGPTGDSKSTETGIIKDWNQGGLKVLWTTPITQSYGTGTVSRGRFFLFDSQPIRGDLNTGIVSCLNAETGRELWRYSYKYKYRDQYGYNNGPRNSPIVDGDRVYAYGVAGRMTCLNVVDGQMIWSVDTNEKFGVVQNFFGVGSNPVVVGDLVIAMVGGSRKRDVNIARAVGNGSGIVAFNKFDGSVRYKLSDELASYASLKAIHLSTRPWCFAFARGGLLGFNPITGKQDFFFPWRARSLESVNASVPVVFGNHVFISETYGPGSALLDFSSIRDGVPKVVWKDQKESRSKSMQTHWNTAIYHNGYLYGSSGRHHHNAELRCIEAKSGKVMWTVPDLSRCSLLYADEHLVCLSEDGTLILLRATPDKYDVVANTLLTRAGRSLIRPPAWAAPILSHGLLYVRGRDRLVCVELINRQE